MFVITFIPTYSIIPGGTKTKANPSLRPDVNAYDWANSETRRVRKMSFSVFNYYTKTKEKTANKRRETKNIVKKTEMKKILCENFINRPTDQQLKISLALCENKNKFRVRT